MHEIKTMASTSGITEESCSSNTVAEHRGSEGEYLHRDRTQEVYREEEQQDRLIFKPAEWIIQLIALQFKGFLQIFTLISWAVSSSFSVVAEPVHRTVQAKDRATEAVTQKLAMISQVPPRVTEGGGMVLRKLGFGCLAAIYVFSVLIAIMMFALLLALTFVTIWIEKPVIIRESLHFDYTQPNPSAIVSFNGTRAGFDPPQKVSGRRIIPAGHKFYVTVTLVMPESDYNRRIGMFQVTAELISSAGEVIVRSSQPCMLHFRSSQVHLLRTFLMGLPLLMGILGETQTVEIHLISYEEKITPTESVKIILQPKAGRSGLPELHSAEIDIHSQLPLIKEFALSWKWTFCVWSALTFYFLLVGLVICCCKQVILPRSLLASKTDHEQLKKVSEELHGKLKDTGMPESSRRHIRSKSRSVSFAQESPTLSSQRTATVLTSRHGDQREISEISEEPIIDDKILTSEDGAQSVQESVQNVGDKVTIQNVAECSVPKQYPERMPSQQ